MHSLHGVPLLHRDILQRLGERGWLRTLPLCTLHMCDVRLRWLHAQHGAGSLLVLVCLCAHRRIVLTKLPRCIHLGHLCVLQVDHVGRSRDLVVTVTEGLLLGGCEETSRFNRLIACIKYYFKTGNLPSFTH